jgi:enoyl-CoA hydratase/carnithine racemase
MAYNTLRYEVKDSILTLTLNRPDRLNSFTIEMGNELVDAFQRASDEDDIRAVVVTGSGRAFCAGMELSAEGNAFGLDETLTTSFEDMEERLEDPEIIKGARDTGGRVTLAIYNCVKPVIAAINGAAIGVGATMTCAMDIRLASENAHIGFLSNKLGNVPEACSNWFLSRLVGVSQALEGVYSGDILRPEEAKEGGFVKTVVPADSLLEEAYKIARKITSHSPVAITPTRQMMYRNSAQPHPIEAHKIDSLAMFYTSIGDGKEGVQAFLDKRQAEFKQTKLPAFYPW